MSKTNRRRQAAGLMLGLGLSATTARAQGLPDPLPELSPEPVAVAAPLMPRPSVIEVPPTGVLPSWRPDPLDPVATERHSPKFVAHKRRWWHWRRYQGKLGGYPENYEPRPLGSALHDHGRAMVANGAAARLTLFRYDFVDDTVELNARGRDQVFKLAAQLAASPFPLIIERTPENPGLAEARRASVLAALASSPYPAPIERVLVGQPMSRGISGIDAQIIGANALDRTKDFGPPIPIDSNGVNSPSGVTSR
ncbi:hypothetical protein EP7_002310 [Isosphaeraceae bacterium EP7]